MGKKEQCLEDIDSQIEKARQMKEKACKGSSNPKCNELYNKTIDAITRNKSRCDFVE